MFLLYILKEITRNVSSTKYNYDWSNYDKELMKEFNWFLYKVNQRSAIQLGYSDEQYESVNRHGKNDFGLGEDVEYFHPTITLDDRMRFIGQEIASLDTSIMNIVGNTFISHFYGGRGVHFLASGQDGEFVDFDRIADNDNDYKAFIKGNLDKAIKNKQPIWGTTELHTSIQTASRNYCRDYYNQPDRKFHAFDVCEWVSSFRDTGFLERMQQCNHMSEIYTLLREQPGIGHYYGFHGAASSSVLPQMKYHHDQRFVSPGPGAVYTIQLMWPEAPKKLYDEAIYYMRENSDEIGLTKNVEFHPKAFNINKKDGTKLFQYEQDSLKYYGTEVLSCQFGVYLQIREDERACARRRVARVQKTNNLTEFFE